MKANGTITFELTQGQTTVIDRADWDKVKGYKWYAKRIPNYPTPTFHVMANTRLPKDADAKFGTSQYRYTTLAIHRVIMDAPVGLSVDHINHDTLDNRRSNLRLATQYQQLANSRRGRKPSSGFSGVYPITSGGTIRYQAKIRLRGSSVFLGVFDTAEEAARSYDRTKIIHFGEFAKTNGLEFWLTPVERVARSIVLRDGIENASVKDLLLAGATF